MRHANWPIVSRPRNRLRLGQELLKEWDKITGYLEQVEAAMHDRTLSDTERRARGESALRLGAVGTGIAHGMRTDQPVGWSRRYVEQVKLWA